MLIGLAAGSIAAIIAALVSLPLHSPLDSAFNSATVAVATLIVGIIAGQLWGRLEANPRRPGYYLAGLAVGFAAVVVIAVVGGIWLERVISFAVPLAAIAFVLSGGLVPLLERAPASALRWGAGVFLIGAVAVGGGLIGLGDAESGELSLPERVQAPAATPAPEQSPTSQPAATVAPPPTSTVAPTAVSGSSPTASTEESQDTPAAIAAPAPTAAGTEAPDTPAATVAPAPTAAGTEAPDTPALLFVVGEGSEITFTVGEELTRLPLPIEAVIRTDELSGQINLAGEPSVIEVNLHSLSSDQNFRDQYIRSRMFPEQPEATFTVDAITELPEEFYSGEQFEYQVDGTLNINGIDVPLAFELEVRKDGEVLNVLGRTVFTWDQLQIPVPTARSVVRVDDEVRVQVLLIAKPN